MSVACAYILSACDRGPPEDAVGVPASFSPAEKLVHVNGRTARCNTVHSLTLPETMLKRLSIAANPNVAVISCSLQIMENGVVRALPASVYGTATALSGNISKIDFKRVVEEETVSHVGTFTVGAKAGVRFDVSIVDVQAGTRYQVNFQQTQV